MYNLHWMYLIYYIFTLYNSKKNNNNNNVWTIFSRYDSFTRKITLLCKTYIKTTVIVKSKILVEPQRGILPQIYPFHSPSWSCNNYVVIGCVSYEVTPNLTVLFSFYDKLIML